MWILGLVSHGNLLVLTAPGIERPGSLLPEAKGVWDQQDQRSNPVSVTSQLRDLGQVTEFLQAPRCD